MSYRQTSVLPYKGRSTKIYWKFQKSIHQTWWETWGFFSPLNWFVKVRFLFPTYCHQTWPVPICSWFCSICVSCRFSPIIACEVCTESVPAILSFRHGPDSGQEVVWIRGPIQRWEQTYQKTLLIPRASTWGLLRTFENEVLVGRHFLQDVSPCQPYSSWKRKAEKAAPRNMVHLCCGDNHPITGHLWSKGAENWFLPSHPEPWTSAMTHPPTFFTGCARGAGHTSVGFRWELESAGPQSAIPWCTLPGALDLRNYVCSPYGKRPHLFPHPSLLFPFPPQPPLPVLP